ncbi:hypothetical protein G6F24_015761 [Rhizopus arrhizus]|nr:hypothetical protein G6F24_015761 [Rhizopus arrhizus]
MPHGRPAGRPGKAAGRRQETGRHPGRHALGCARRAAVRRFRAAPCAAHRGLGPPPDAIPGGPPVLHRRRGPGHQPGVAQARGRCGPDPAGRRPHVGKPQPGLHAAGHPGAQAKAGARASRHRRAGPRVPRHPCHQHVAGRLRGIAGRPEGACQARVGRRHPGHARARCKWARSWPTWKRRCRPMPS